MIKRYIFLFLFISIMVFIYIPCGNVAYATEGTDKSQLEDEINENINNIDWSELESYLNSLDDEYTVDVLGSVKDLCISIIDGNNKLSFGEFINFILKIIIGELRLVLPIGGTTIAVCILLSISKEINNNSSKNGVNQIVQLIGLATILTLISFLITDCIDTAYKNINSITKFMDISFPILLTLMTALGGTTTVVLYQPIMLIYSTYIIKIINFAIFPLFYGTLIFSILNNISDSINLDKFASTTKSLANWVLGIVFSIFISYITAQGITGTSIDSLAIRGTKYALSSYVPVIGGYIKDGLDIVMASCVVIKNALGFSMILLLIITSLLPIIKILIINFSLKLIASIVQPIADKKISNMLFSISSSLFLLVEIIVCITFSVFVVLMLIIYSCNWGLL